MSTADPRERLLDVALAVGDGRAVDWEGALEDSPGMEGPLARLRDLAQLAVEAPPAVADGALFAWGPLRVLRRLGAGSFGEVFAAWDPALQREVALKLRRTEAGANGSLAWLEEARRLARVRHPNVLSVYGADVHDERAGLWTELLDGRTLEQTLAAQGPLGAREAAVVGLDLCAALAAVHAAGLVHGDVKASNVMRVGAASGEVGASGRIVLMDFGAAHDGARAGLLGTPLAAAPELLEGDAATPASDLYALGALLFRLTTQRHPFEATTLDELRARHARGERARLRDVRPDLPRSFVDAVERALEHEPASRWPSAAALERALSEVVTPAPADRPARGARPRSAALAGIAALVLAAIATALWALALRRPPAAAVPAPVASPPAAVRVSAGGATTPAVPLAETRPLEVDAALCRVGERGSEVLRDGDRVSPGDRLFLELTPRAAVYAYVLEEDETGNVFVLFPLAGRGARDPLAAGVRHRLPGRDGGQELDWEVTSAGAHERFLIVASTKPEAAIERAVARLRAARADAEVQYAPLGDDALGQLRHVGGIARRAAPAAEDAGRLAAVRRALEGAPRERMWVRLLVLENPR